MDVAVASRSPDPALAGVHPERWHMHRVDAMDEALLAGLLSATHPEHLVISVGQPNMAPLAKLDARSAMTWIAERIAPLVSIAHWAAARPAGLASITIVCGFPQRRPQPAGSALWGLVGSGMPGFIEALAVELGPVRVNGVGPGFIVDSPLAAHILGGAEQASAAAEHLASTLPARRAVRLEELARSIVLLFSESAVTGTLRVVDGGMSISA